MTNFIITFAVKTYEYLRSKIRPVKYADPEPEGEKN